MHLYWQWRVYELVPVTISLGTHLGTSLRSLMGVRTPSTLPNMEERPRLKSIMKNRTAHICEPGISSTASVKEMNASPVPDALWGRRIKRTLLNMNTLDLHCRWGGYEIRRGMFQYQVKECLQVTVQQRQPGDIVWIFLVQMVKPVVIVLGCYILVRKLKVIGQSQNVSAGKRWKKVSHT